jgi:alkylhydroperoxidase/carboxymuconolactone decarboxylase family protein YurZ
MNANPMQLFAEEAPEAAAAFDGLIKAVCARSDGIDGKTRQLLYLAMKASQGDAAAIYAHVPMAKAEGATRGEVRDAILMTLTVSGIRGVVSCLGPALGAYDASPSGPEKARLA